MNTPKKSPGENGAPNPKHLQYKPADALLTKLQRVRQNGAGRWTACCPAAATLRGAAREISYEV
jgi:hypothetical protein